MVKKKKNKTSFLKSKLQFKRILVKGKQPTLDLRKVNIEPIKQHGFKEKEVSSTNILNQ